MFPVLVELFVLFGGIECKGEQLDLIVYLLDVEAVSVVELEVVHTGLPCLVVLKLLYYGLIERKQALQLQLPWLGKHFLSNHILRHLVDLC